MSMMTPNGGKNDIKSGVSHFEMTSKAATAAITLKIMSINIC